MLRLENISRLYKTRGKTVAAVDDISLEFVPGELVAILGLSGSGKTTLVSQIGGLDRPTDGRLIINGVDTSDYKSQDWNNYRLNNIGFVFQDFNLISHLTAKENIEIALSLSGYSTKEKSDRADELLEQMGLADRGDQLPTQLSGGEKQRIAIARALANHPDIILADEPTGALDPDTATQIMNILKDLSAKGHLVIMVTHNKYLARDYATRIVELSKGKVIAEEFIDQGSELNISDINKEPSHSRNVGTNVRKLSEDATDFKRSSLELGAAFKIAYNNLKIRRKSTFFSLASLIPSMILIFALINLVFNLYDYKRDFYPITEAVLNNEQTYYITPFTDTELDMDVKRAFSQITDRQYDYEAIATFLDSVMVPYDEEDRQAIEAIPGVSFVMDPMMFNVTIDSKEFIMVTLPPRAYSDYQYAVKNKYYPSDDEQGVILSQEAAKRILGKYNDDLAAIEDMDLNIQVNAVNGFGVVRDVLQSDLNDHALPVITMMDIEPKTTLIENYYGGYIYVPYDLGRSIYESLDVSTLTMISTRPPDAMSGETEPVILGPLYGMDLLKPLREKTMLQESYNLFEFREFTYMFPSNNYSIKRMIITDGNFDDQSMAELESFGVVTTSAFDEMTLTSAATTDKYINYSILGASLFALAVILIPSLLVSVILYISILLRVKEIGILKSLGARNKDIRYIFTIEAGLVALVGTLAGLAAAIPVIAFIQNMLEDRYRISFYLGSNPLRYNLAGLAFAGVMAFLLVTLFGLLPGHKASKLQPNVLLKHIN